MPAAMRKIQPVSRWRQSANAPTTANADPIVKPKRRRTRSSGLQPAGGLFENRREIQQRNPGVRAEFSHQFVLCETIRGNVRGAERHVVVSADEIQGKLQLILA